MSELLLEILSEEIPAVMHLQAQSAYFDIFTKFFEKHNIDCRKINVYVDVRRVILHVEDIAVITKSQNIKVRGPAIDALQQAIDGFCKSKNISRDDLSIEEYNSKKYYYYNANIEGIKTTDIIKNNISDAISEYSWPKSMRWGNYSIRWVRPIRNILCILDGAVLPFKYGHLEANNFTYGHRFHNNIKIIVNNFADYSKKLKENNVIFERDKKREIILRDMQNFADKMGLYLNIDENLFDEVIGIVETPYVKLGKINSDFLLLPKEVLVTTMKKHQKYFPLFDKDGNFAPYFLFVANINPEDDSAIIKGNEKVLSARLADAKYFYDVDLESSIEERCDQLKNVVYYEGFGTLHDKMLRLVDICKFLSPDNSNLAKAASICKNDIVSEVVKELPNLQGIMGYYYALKAELDEDIAISIGQHYKPQGTNDDVPKGNAALLSIADKIDNICMMFCIRGLPNGSKDPYAMRRQALSIISLILANNLEIDLMALIDNSMDIVKNMFKLKDSIDRKELLKFFNNRLHYFFKNKYDFDLISSLIDKNKNENILHVNSKIVILDEFIKTEQGNELVAAYHRVKNIIDKSQDGIILSNSDIKLVDDKLFDHEDERKLYSNLQEINKKLQEILHDYTLYSQQLNLLTGLVGYINLFCDNVTVYGDDKSITLNRLHLLSCVRNLFEKLAYFHHLQAK